MLIYLFVYRGLDRLEAPGEAVEEARLDELDLLREVRDNISYDSILITV